MRLCVGVAPAEFGVCLSVPVELLRSLRYIRYRWNSGQAADRESSCEVVGRTNLPRWCGHLRLAGLIRELFAVSAVLCFYIRWRDRASGS